MVIGHILGGIGNQMFQYAAARALSLSKEQPLYLDILDFDGYSLHSGFQLNTAFCLQTKLADSELIRKILGFRNQQLIKKLIKRPLFKFLRGCNFIMEPHAHYWSQIESAPENCYLYGYWQSEKYFKSIEAIIRKDFQFRHPLDEMNASMQSSMRECQSIGLHIRRGDYLTHRGTTKVMAVCTTDYYQKAVDYINSHVIDPVFYIFSDDISWAKTHLKIPNKSIYVDHNLGVDSYKDMQLMSSCKHHVIANSTFSWWGAWLNPSLEKIVIAPKRWFVNDYKDDDLIPSSWVRL
ncbi:alpha-1,2-fucosyltransferase [Polynucleobacter paneuropaeus]|nr:alpha-1,2-fucosyltransferase [Polynucleobacter paneuropaeus]